MKCHRCNNHIGSFDPPHSCIYDERDALLKRVVDLETELSKTELDKGSNDRDYLELSVRHSALDNKIEMFEDALNKIYDIAILGTNSGSIEVTRIIASLGITK